MYGVSRHVASWFGGLPLAAPVPRTYSLAFTYFARIILAAVWYPTPSC